MYWYPKEIPAENSKQIGPTIEVAGSCTFEQCPTSGQIIVKLKGVGVDREVAWTEFHARLKLLKDQLGELAKVGNAVPKETQQEGTKMLRTVNEFHVSADIAVGFAPGDFGNLVATLVANNLPYSTPTFQFDSNFSITEEMLTAAAADAKNRATAIVQGLNSSIGRLVSVTVGKPRRKPEYRTWHSSGLAHSLSNFSFDSLNWDEEEFETFDLVATITVEYEVIEADSKMEVPA